MLADPVAAEGDWLIALKQDGGRGRYGRVWESIVGNFHGSTLIQLRPSDPPAPSLALVAGLALVEALDVAAPAANLSLKWPNDLMLGDAKLAGILLERSGEQVVAGFGINLAGAPAISGRKTAALNVITNVSPQDLAPILAARFEAMLGAWRAAEPPAFAQAWMARAHPLGTALNVFSGPSERISGSFDGIEADGAMRLKLDDGSIEIVRAADVSLA